MRTKTLLLAAAITVAGFVSSQAATVYSQNVVGYINITVTNGQYALIANQLNASTNTINNVFQSGPVSGNTTMLFWTGVGYRQFLYYNTGDSPDGGSGWYDVNTDQLSTNTLSPGQGVFVQNTSGANISLTTVGQVVQGTNLYSIPGVGYSIYSVPNPIAGQGLDLINFPAVSGVDTYLKWTGTGYYQLIYYNSGDSPDGGTGWYDFSDVNQSTNPAAWAKVGESFFINHGGSTLTWTNVFVVQP